MEEVEEDDDDEGWNDMDDGATVTSKYAYFNHKIW
jgi:hypothetical protein